MLKWFLFKSIQWKYNPNNLLLEIYYFLSVKIFIFFVTIACFLILFSKIYFSCCLCIFRAIHLLIRFSFRRFMWKLTSFFSCSECFSARCDNKMRSSWKLHRAASRSILYRRYASLLIIRLFERATANVYYFLPRAILFSAKCIAQVIIATTAGSLYYPGKFVILGRLINSEDIPGVCTYPDRLKQERRRRCRFRNCGRILFGPGRVIKSPADSST